jgi:UDP-2-acetamido-2-deoxy-ribo-hexuluronate aminotransferase
VFYPNKVKKRSKISQTYTSGLANAKGLKPTSIGEHNTSVYAQYTILSEKREEIQKTSKKKIFPQYLIIFCPYTFS